MLRTKNATAEPRDSQVLASRWPELDVAALESKLGTMVSHGQADAPKLAHVELTAAARHHAYVLDEYAAEQRRAYLERMKVRDVRPDIDQEATRSLARLESEFTRSKREIADSQSEWRNKLNDYDRFRVNHGLKREPYYCEDRFRHILIAIVAIIAETVLNGNILATGAQGGLLQGWTLAFGIAFINVAGAFCAGNLARMVNHRKWSRRTIGFLSIAFCTCILILFNLLVAHYREALLASQGYTETIEAGQQAWTAFSENYIGVSDFMSWMLFALGMISAGIGAWKGYTMEDPYPHYSRLARALRTSDVEFKDGLEDALREFDIIQEEAVRSIDQYVNDYRLRLSNAQSQSMSLAELPSRLSGERRKLLNSLTVLHAEYCAQEREIELEETVLQTVVPSAKNVPAKIIVDHAKEKRDEIIQLCHTVVAELSSPQDIRLDGHHGTSKT